MGVSDTDSEQDWLDFLVKNNESLCALHPIASLREEELFALETMKHIKEGIQFPLEELTQQQNRARQGFLLSEKEVMTRFQEADLTKAVEGAQRLANSISFEFQFHQKLLPHYPVPGNKTAGEYLDELCQTQLSKRLAQITPEYQERLTYELSVIHQMGFDDYFLIVWDVMAFTHQNNIVTGAGRGSAAGSLVAYILEITDVDPLKYDLLFERF